MAEYISIPVTSEGTQNISAQDVIIVEQASTTTVTVTYRSASSATDVVTITHTAIGGGTYSVRDSVQAALKSAHSISSRPSAVVAISLPSGIAVSAIAVA